MKKLFLLAIAALISTVILAQEGGGETKRIDVNINTNGGEGAWYTSPWVWVIGAAVFILLLVALLRGGGRRSD